jgi:hypothetical protein
VTCSHSTRILEIDREEEAVIISHKRQVLTFLCASLVARILAACWKRPSLRWRLDTHPLEGAKLFASGEWLVGQEMREKCAVLREQMGV